MATSLNRKKRREKNRRKSKFRSLPNYELGQVVKEKIDTSLVDLCKQIQQERRTVRYMRITVSGQFLTLAAIEGHEVHAKCVKGLPEGTVFKYAIPDAAYGISMVVEHESFAELKDGDLIPIFERPLMENLPCKPKTT